MNKQYFIEKTSTIAQTSQDEFKDEFNSPEMLWDNFLDYEIWNMLYFAYDRYRKFGDAWIRISDGHIVSAGDIVDDYSNNAK